MMSEEDMSVRACDRHKFLEDNIEKYSLAELGARMGCTRQRVHQLIQQYGLDESFKKGQVFRKQSKAEIRAQQKSQKGTGKALKAFMDYAIRHEIPTGLIGGSGNFLIDGVSCVSGPTPVKFHTLSAISTLSTTHGGYYRIAYKHPEALNVVLLPNETLKFILPSTCGPRRSLYFRVDGKDSRGSGKNRPSIVDDLL
jgi:hypothetical protein